MQFAVFARFGNQRYLEIFEGMKRGLKPLLSLLLLLAVLCVSTAAAQEDLYKRYANRTDIRVASVTNFALDSAITADVTLLEAVDDEGWQWMCKEFSLAQPTKEQQEHMDEGWDVVMFAQRSRLNPALPAEVKDEKIDHSSSCYVGVSYLSRTIYIFCCTTDRQSDVVVNYLIEKMRKSMRP